MNKMQTNHRLLLISSDTFIVGLFKGYCFANQLILDALSSYKTLQPEDINTNSRLIILDARKINASLTRSNIKILRRMCENYHIPVCAIRDHHNEQLNQIDSWVDCFFDDPITEQLDNYFRIHFGYNSHPFPDRRCKERRCKERRTKVDRRAFCNSQTSSPPHLLNNPASEPLKNQACHMLGPFEIDRICKSVSVRGRNLELTSKEYKLFNLLAADTERVFSTDEIIQHLWPETDRANKSDLYQYMHRLRKKVEEDHDNPHWILTIKGVGYKFQTAPMNASAA